MCIYIYIYMRTLPKIVIPFVVVVTVQFLKSVLTQLTYRLKMLRNKWPRNIVQQYEDLLTEEIYSNSKQMLLILQKRQCGFMYLPGGFACQLYIFQTEHNQRYQTRFQSVPTVHFTEGWKWSIDTDWGVCRWPWPLFAQGKADRPLFRYE